VTATATRIVSSVFTGLITSKTRIRVLMRLFLNPDQAAYLRELADEFQMSPSLVRTELQQLTEAELLTSARNGRQIHFQANTHHPLFPELQSMVRKALGMDRIIDSIVQRLGNLQEAFLIDDYAEGKDTGIIDLVLVGEVDPANLDDLVRKTERYIERKIRTLVLTVEEHAKLKPSLDQRPRLLLWSADGMASRVA
jgi:AraC-like DNA-binding protein